MEHLVPPILPIFLFVALRDRACRWRCWSSPALFNPGRPGRVTRMPYESGMDPIHDTRRRFDVRFHLLAIAFLVFDVELLFLYPWAVVGGQGMGTSAEGMGTSMPSAAAVGSRQSAVRSRQSLTNRSRLGIDAATWPMSWQQIATWCSPA